jgi:hypothetical protein
MHNVEKHILILFNSSLSLLFYFYYIVSRFYISDRSTICLHVAVFLPPRNERGFSAWFSIRVLLSFACMCFCFGRPGVHHQVLLIWS